MPSSWSSPYDTVWYSWASNDATSSSSTAIYDNVWRDWSGGTSTSNSWTSANNDVWGEWVTRQYRYQANGYTDPWWSRSRELTDEQRAARERERENRRVRNAHRDSQRRQAKYRAKRLLLENLSPAQREEYRKSGEFIVESASGRLYVIREGDVGNVYLLSDDGVTELSQLCIHPREQVPVADTMLAQKLLLEASEAEFWRIVNVHWGKSLRSELVPA